MNIRERFLYWRLKRKWAWAERQCRLRGHIWKALPPWQDGDALYCMWNCQRCTAVRLACRNAK